MEESVFFTEKGSFELVSDNLNKYYQGRLGFHEKFGNWYSNVISCWKNDKLWGPGTKHKIPPEGSYHAYFPYCSIMEKYNLLPFKRGSNTK